MMRPVFLVKKTNHNIKNNRKRFLFVVSQARGKPLILLLYMQGIDQEVKVAESDFLKFEVTISYV